MFMLWLIGLAAKRKQLHYGYQANTLKTQRVLSLVFLALQVLQYDKHALCHQDLKDALQHRKTSKQKNTNYGNNIEISRGSLRAPIPWASLSCPQQRLLQ